MIAALLAASLLLPVQNAPVVQCQIGYWADYAPDYACRAITRGALKLNAHTDGYGIKPCAKEVSRYLVGDWPEFLGICEQVFSAQAEGGYR